MSALAYYLALPFLYLISLLPFPIMYLLSDGVYVLLYYIIGYRKKVVMNNLKNSFPNKSEPELKRLQKDFYHHLCDLFLETLKTLTLSKEAMLKRCSFAPGAEAVFLKYVNEKKTIVVVMGHLGNWEWSGSSFALLSRVPLYVLYHPLHNKHFDKLVCKMRTRFGTKLIAVRDTAREMLKLKGETIVATFIADQAGPPESSYWTTFMNQDTPVFLGSEKIARKFNYPVVYVAVKKVKRGFYQIHAETLVEESGQTKENEITELHTRRLEKDIIAQPEIWLWSHRRWKHKRVTSGQ